MAQQQPGGIGLADIIQLWIGLAVSLSALFAWLMWRVTKAHHLMAVPYLKRSDIGGDGGMTNVSLAGEGADQWQIALVRVISPRRVQIMRVQSEYDFGGSMVRTELIPVGRSVAYPSNPIAVSSVERPVKLAFKLSLKSSPSVTSWRTMTISKND